MIVDDAPMLFMIVEHFEGGDPAPVYRRFAERGRMAPPGLDYHGSWVTDDLTRCYQVMECADRSLLEEWMSALGRSRALRGDRGDVVGRRRRGRRGARRASS